MDLIVRNPRLANIPDDPVTDIGVLGGRIVAIGCCFQTRTTHRNPSPP